MDEEKPEVDYKDSLKQTEKNDCDENDVGGRAMDQQTTSCRRRTDARRNGRRLARGGRRRGRQSAMAASRPAAAARLAAATVRRQCRDRVGLAPVALVLAGRCRCRRRRQRVGGVFRFPSLVDKLGAEHVQVLQLVWNRAETRHRQTAAGVIATVRTVRIHLVDRQIDQHLLEVLDLGVVGARGPRADDTGRRRSVRRDDVVG